MLCWHVHVAVLYAQVSRAQGAVPRQPGSCSTAVGSGGLTGGDRPQGVGWLVLSVGSCAEMLGAFVRLCGQLFGGSRVAMRTCLSLKTCDDIVVPAHACMLLCLHQGRLPLDLVSHELRQQLRLAESSAGPSLSASTATAASASAPAHSSSGGGSGNSSRAGGSRSDSGGLVGFSNLYSWGNGSNFTLGTGGLSRLFAIVLKWQVPAVLGVWLS